MIVKSVFKSFVSAEAAEVADHHERIPLILLTFEEQELGVLDTTTISCRDGMDMVAGLLQALADHGDRLAQEIGERYFMEDPDD
jgi:hypothetical protein